MDQRSSPDSLLEIPYRESLIEISTGLHQHAGFKASYNIFQVGTLVYRHEMDAAFADIDVAVASAESAARSWINSHEPTH